MPGFRRGRRGIGPPLFGSGYRASPAGPAGNYWSPAKTPSNLQLSDGNKNLTFIGPGFYGFSLSVTGHATGKRYAELVLGSTDSFGLANASADFTNGLPGDVNSAIWWSGDGAFIQNEVPTSYGSAQPPGTIMGLAWDGDAKCVYVAANNVYMASGNPVAGTGGYVIGLTGALSILGSPNEENAFLILRTALADFTYAPPSGYSAWG